LLNHIKSKTLRKNLFIPPFAPINLSKIELKQIKFALKGGNENESTGYMKG